jgi:hypothetical protein
MATRRSPPLDWNAPSDCHCYPQRVFHSIQLAARWQGGAPPDSGCSLAVIGLDLRRYRRLALTNATVPLPFFLPGPG